MQPAETSQSEVLVEKPRIIFSEFVRRQTEKSQFSHFTGTEAELIALTQEHFDKQLPAYRDGVLRIPVPSEGFMSGIVQLKKGDKLSGVFKPRGKGEDSRKGMYLSRTNKKVRKIPAKYTEVILYHWDVLAEKEDMIAFGYDPADKGAWVIISINGSPLESTPVPVDPMTLIYNHFEMSGGSATGMNDSEFVAALRESMEFWKDKSLGPGD